MRLEVVGDLSDVEFSFVVPLDENPCCLSDGPFSGLRRVLHLLDDSLALLKHVCLEVVGGSSSLPYSYFHVVLDTGKLLQSSLGACLGQHGYVSMQLVGCLDG